MNTELKRTGRLSAWAVAGMASLIVAAPVGAQPFSVTQPGVITINDNSSATPYPSSIVVSNVVGTIEKVTVSLNGITHGYPDDIDVLLVGPDTNAVVVMSDAGLGFDLNSVTLTFDDAASASLPDDTQITAGTYKPSNYEGSSTDPFVAPAPAGPYNATLSVFTNGNPNGTWRLFVVDDNLVDAGSISSGWTLNLWTTPTVSVTNAVATLEDTPVTVNVTVGDSDDPPNNLIVSGTSSDQTVVTNTAIVAGGSGTARTLTITPRTNQFGTVTITVLVKDGLATVSSNLTLTINPVNDNPTISLNTNKVSTVAGVLTTNLIAVLRDVDDNVDTLQLSASSSNTNVVANTNVFFVRGVNGTNTFTIAPVGAATGTATLTIQVSDGHGSNATSTATIDVTVNPVPHAIFGNSNPITINDNAVASPYPSQLTVSNVSGLIGKLTVVLADVTHNRPDDIDVLLVGPQGQAVVLMGQAGDANAIDRVRLTFDQGAASVIPNSAQITTGSYRPADYTAGNLPSSAPAGPYSTNLDSFIATNPNGTWKLFVFDGVTGQAGTILGGFVLNIFPAPTIANVPTQNTDEDMPLTVNFTVADFDGTVTNVTASSTNTSLVTATASLTNGTSVSVVLTPVANQFGTNQNVIEIVATDNSGFKATNFFTVGIKAVNDAPTINAIQRQVTRAGVPIGPVTFTVGDVETAAGSLAVTATSSNQKVLPNSNIVLGGGGANRTITLFPIGTQAATALVTVTVSDGVASTSANFDLVVLDPGNPLFENANPITINDNTNASPYPSTISVSGLVGIVAEIKVNLFDITHPQPDDIDILLVGPGGTNKVVIMSSAGGANGLTNTALVLEDSAAASLPDTAQIISGTYKPSVYGTPTFAAPAPAGPYGTTLSGFTGITPNGSWSLYVVDHAVGPKGGIINGGWQLNIRTAPKVSPIADQPTPEDTPLRVNVVIGDDQPGVPLTVTATSSDQTLVANTNIVVSGTGANRTLTITPVLNANGTNTITVTVSDGVNSSTANFRFIVTPVDDPPAIQLIADQTTPAGLPVGPINFTVSDPETPATNITVTASSSDQSLVPDASITLGGSGTNRTISLVPVGVRTGQSTITLTATDATGQKSTRSFLLTVTRNISFANAQRIDIQDATISAPGTSIPYPSVITVANVGGLVSRVTVILDGFTHGFPDDVDILLVSPDNSKKVMVMSDAGGGGPGNAANNLRLTFSDSAASAIPDNSALTSGVFRPADYEPGESLPSPAPAGPYATTLASFAGINPNGDWKLYVSDDTFSDAGSIERGWFLILETAPTISPVAAQTTQEDTPLSVRFTLSDADTDPTNLVVLATSSSNSPPSLVVNSNLVVTGPSNVLDRTLVITPTTNLFGTNLINVSVTDGTSTNSISFPLTVTAVNDPPTVNTATNVVTINEDNGVTIVYTIGDVDSILALTNVVVTSSDPTIVPNTATNLAIAGSITTNAPGSTGTVNVSVVPATNAFGSNVLTFTVTDGAITTTNTLTLIVNPVNDPPFISSITNQSVVAGGSTTNIAFQVSDVETQAKSLIVTKASSDQNLVPDGNITLGGSGTDRTVQVTSIGTNTGVLTISLVVSDGAASTTNTFQLTVTPATSFIFANTGVITIRDNNTAQPYPSTINVSGLVGAVHRVFVTLDGFTHTAPDDVDILLVSPGGQKIILMSDAGGRNAVTNVRLRFDDAAPPLPDETPLSSASYSPTDYQPGDVFPAPAPAGPYGNTLAAFKGGNPNGTWSLYIVDDTSNDTGQIAQGWSLTIEPAPTINITSPTPPAAAVFAEDTTANVLFTIGDMVTPVTNLTLLASSSNPTLLPDANVTFAQSGPNITATLRPAANQFGTNNLTLTVRRSDGATASAVVPMNVTPVNDPPVISRLTQKSTDANTPLTINFFVTDVDTANTNLSLLATSSDQSIIANNNLLFFGSTNRLLTLPDNNVQFTMVPNSTANGSATISITATDRVDNTVVSSNFVLVVTAVNIAPSISSIPSPQFVQSGQFTTNIAFTVTDPDSPTLTVTGTSSDQTLVKNTNIVVTPSSGSQTNRTVQILAEPNVTNTVPVTITLSVTDGSKTTNTSFVLNVRPSRERIFVNSQLITIRDNNSAQPYPSVINVSGLAGSIAKVRVTLNGFAHRFPDDVDVLLVSPGGQKVIPLSDAGGGGPVTNLDLTLDDDAAAQVPDSGPMASGSFKPSNYDATADNFVAPAPGGPYGSTLSAFSGVSPNGAWSLYVMDDTPSDSGSINGGWTLAITTQPMINGLADVTSQEDVPARVNFTIAEESFASQSNFTFSATSTNTAVVATNGVTFTGSGTNWSAVVTPVANASGTTEITVSVGNADGQTVSGKFQATFTPVNDAPTITSVPNQVITAGTITPTITFDYSDVETARKDLVLQIQSTNAGLIPTNNIVIVGNQLTIAPVGNLSGTSQITLTVTDQAGASTNTGFAITVLPSPNPLFANTNDITIRDNTSAVPYPSTITVSNVSGTVSQVTVTLAQVSHTFPDDIDILLVGPQGQRVTLMSDAGGGSALSGVRLTFDDSATASLPDNSTITNGTYKPSNYEGADIFAAPAPAGPYSAALSVFNGIDPNGTWSLYVQDDASPDSGVITGGWLLRIITTQPTIQISGGKVHQLLEDTPETNSITLSDPDTPLTNLVVSVSTDNTNLLSLSLSGTGGTRSLVITPKPNAFGSNATVTATVSDGTSTNQDQIVVNVAAVNDAPTISGLSNTNTPADRPLTVTFTVNDLETAASNLTVTASTSVPALGTVAVGGTNAARTLTFTPSGAIGNTTVSVAVSDGGLTTTNTFVIQVTTPPPALTISSIADQTVNEDTTLPPLAFTIANSTSNLVVTGSASNSTLVSSVVIGGSGTNRTALITLVTNAFGSSAITITATDSSSTATRSFTLTVVSVDDPPTLAPIAAQTTTQNTPVRVALTVSDVDTPITNLTFSATSDTNLVSGVVFTPTATNVLATVNLVSNKTGTASVTIFVKDTTNQVSQTFALTVTGAAAQPTLGASRPTASTLRVSLAGVAGTVYVIEGTSNFVTWATFGTVTGNSSGAAQLDVTSNTNRYQFFRARVQ